MRQAGLTLISHQNAARLSRGFNLVELAIVLGIIGAVLGALWQVVTVASAHSNRAQTIEAINLTVANIRQLYGGQLAIATGIPTYSLAPILVQQKVVPDYLLRATNDPNCTMPALSPLTGDICLDTPFGYPTSTQGLKYGTFEICQWLSNGTACVGNQSTNTFAIVLLELDMRSCIELASQVASANGPSGLINVNINGAGGNITYGRTLTGTGSLPPAMPDLQALCSSTNPNSVAFIYRLVAPL